MSRERGCFDCGETIRAVEIGIARAKVARGEENLIGGLQDEGCVEGCVFPKAIVSDQPGKRDTGHGLPGVRVLSGGCGNFGNGRRFSGRGLAWLCKGTGPP